MPAPCSLVRNKEVRVLVTGITWGFCRIKPNVAVNPEMEPLGSCAPDTKNQSNCPVQISLTFWTFKISQSFLRGRGYNLVTEFISAWVITPPFKNIMGSDLAKGPIWIQNPSQAASIQTLKGLTLVLFHQHCAIKRIHPIYLRCLLACLCKEAQEIFFAWSD